jgi:hypothetical protein
MSPHARTHAARTCLAHGVRLWRASDSSCCGVEDGALCAERLEFRELLLAVEGPSSSFLQTLAYANTHARCRAFPRQLHTRAHARALPLRNIYRD